MNAKQPRLKIAENPLAGGRFSNWIRLLRDNDPVERPYIWRAVYITFMTLLFAPVRGLQSAVFSRQIDQTTLAGDPVFVLGHYRSVGTYLMNLLTQDRQWGFISTTQALLPELFLLGRPIRNIFNLFLHEKRPMDNVLVSPESPEEPEHAIGNLTPYGFYQGFCFPRKMRDYFYRSVLFEDPTARQEWETAYRYILKAATLASQGKQLLIKNPPDTARIPDLLALFPKAKFIFLQRNPYVMFPSIRNFYTAYIVDWQLQSLEPSILDENILTIYRLMMERYQQDKHRIPAGNLVEVKFEDFERNATPWKRPGGFILNWGYPAFPQPVPLSKPILNHKRGIKKISIP
ncbi:MAG: sulfotransferase [FCB group bacterium]|nr:sulfotransferase [FCB group bacterium]